MKSVDLSAYRSSQSEQTRISDLMKLMPADGVSALDVGARDGYLSLKLVDYFESVTALDLVKPDLFHERIVPIKGDVTDLSFADEEFDLVLCAEVLEHIPSHLLNVACSELSRVTGKYLIVGVPYKQDIRAGRTTCSFCGGRNPPWGHVNSFDENYLEKLFPNLVLDEISYSGRIKSATNWLSVTLMDWARNPQGTYAQEEPCIYCGKNLYRPDNLSVLEICCAEMALKIKRAQRVFVRERPNWIHVRFIRQ